MQHSHNAPVELQGDEATTRPCVSLRDGWASAAPGREVHLSATVETAQVAGAHRRRAVVRKVETLPMVRDGRLLRRAVDRDRLTEVSAAAVS
jgi:RNA:NAD 2'-phosphotransferase (TPT1/KptA family)